MHAYYEDIRTKALRVTVRSFGCAPTPRFQFPDYATSANSAGGPLARRPPSAKYVSGPRTR